MERKLWRNLKQEVRDLQEAQASLVRESESMIFNLNQGVAAIKDGKMSHILGVERGASRIESYRMEAERCVRSIHQTLDALGEKAECMSERLWKLIMEEQKEL